MQYTLSLILVGGGGGEGCHYITNWAERVIKLGERKTTDTLVPDWFVYKDKI